ncbi:pilus assembly protein TadG-related protein [Aureimonas sp. D3]|uniref:pilus assembly protein TadG-related protein n=1 Tax=Aureimonas sp. D3 TaxID=1638164 RepID=UPI000781C78F|nr:pilus assembly protein TadG-related protein [Aureimonas sp. D3]
MTRLGLFSRLAHNRAGSVALTFCIALPVLVGASAFATDMGNVFLQRRALQGATDAAALAAASQPSKADGMVRRVLDANGQKDARFALTFGEYQTDASGKRSFAPKPGGSVVRVNTSHDVELHFAGIFGLTRETVGTQAEAARTPIVSLSAGSRLASVEPKIVNALLGNLLGISLDLKIADYNALLTTSLPLKPLLSGLAQALGESPVNATLGHVLTTPLKLSVVIDLLAAQSDAKGNKSAAATLRKMAQQTKSSAAMVKLGDALALDPALQSSSLGHVAARVSSSISVIGLVNALLDQTHVGMEVSTGVDAAGLASVSLDLILGERMKKAQSLAVSDRKATITTDQLKMRLRLGLLESPALRLLNTKVELPLELVVAGGTAEVVSATCSDNLWEREVKVAIHPGLARLSLGDTSRRSLAQTHLHDRLEPAIIARVLGLPVVEGSAQIVAADKLKIVTFRGNEIGSGVTKSGETKSILTSLLGSVLGETRLRLLGLPIGNLLDPLKDLLTAAVSPVDTLLNAVLAAVGVRVGEMDVRVDDLVCSQARLVG